MFKVFFREEIKIGVSMKCMDLRVYVGTKYLCLNDSREKDDN